MIRVALLALATATLAATATAASESHDAARWSRAVTRAATATPLRTASPAATATAAPVPAADDPASGLAWRLPTGWVAVRSQLTALAQPVHRLAAATFALRQDKPDRDCRPDTARAQMPAHGMLVFLLEDRESAARPKRLAHYPARPARFRLGRARNYECFGPGSIVWWTEQDRAFQAQVLFGSRAGATRRRQAEALLDSLVVGRIAPPEPPIGWRSVISGAYDSIRVPPGWQAHALKRVHTTPRPRTLFRVANRAETVVVRVTELRRDHGRRFATRVFTRPGATAHDLDWANAAAKSLGVSNAARG